MSVILPGPGSAYAPSLSHAVPLRAAVIGYGQFGRYHTAKYAVLPGVHLAGIVDTDPVRRELARRDYPETPVFAAVDELLATGRPTLASVAVPASQHYAIARQLLAAGTHLLVEKPLAASVNHAWELLQLAQQSQLILQPGHLERFHPCMADLRRRCSAPLAIEAWRLARWSGRGGDVDVVLDMMIHDLDLVLELITAPLVDIQARGISLLTDYWDVVEAHLQFADGRDVKLSVSRAAVCNERQVHLIGGSSCVRLDGIGSKLHVSTIEDERLSGETLIYPRYDVLAAEVEEFVSAVRERRQPAVSAVDGYRALELAQRIVDTIEEDPHLPRQVHRRAPKITASARCMAIRREDRAAAIAD